MSAVLAYLLWARDVMYNPMATVQNVPHGSQRADVETKAQRGPLSRVPKFTGTEQELGPKSVLQAPCCVLSPPPCPGGPGRRRFQLLLLISASVEFLLCS